MQLPHEFKSWPFLDRQGRLAPLKLVVLLLLLVPALWMGYDLITGLWFIPVVGIIYWSGVWGVIMLLAALAVTPIRRIFRLNRVIGVRRMIGVAALIYSLAHTVAYFVLRNWDAAYIVNEMVTRLTLIVATLSLIGLFVLGVTSLDDAIKRMGAVNWDRLHKSTYVFTGLAVWHFLLSPGATGGLPYLFLGMFVWLMAWRWFNARRLGEDLRVLFGLAVACTALVVAAEAIVPALRFGMNAGMTLSFNFSLVLGISPGWQMAAWSFGTAIAALLHQLWRRRPPRNAATAGEPR